MEWNTIDFDGVMGVATQYSNTRQDETVIVNK